VVLDGLLADKQLAGDLLVRATAQGERDDVLLPRREVQRRAVPAARRAGQPRVDQLGIDAIEVGTGAELWVPKTYATRRYSWITPPARSRRRRKRSVCRSNIELRGLIWGYAAW